MQYRFKHTIKLVFVFTVLVLPVFAQAASCNERGYTVVFINGVFDTETQARADADALGRYLGINYGPEPLSVKVGYNATHIGGLGDLIETKLPVFDQYDLDTILMQMHKDVTTRKILLVGHSQGAVYANKIYEYLTSHGVPKEDVAVYAVATPDTYVAGGGKYINYSLDDTIAVVAKMAGFSPLSSNVNFVDFLNSPDVTGTTPNQGHSFIDNYLGAFGSRMVTDMQGQMAALKSMAGTAVDGCFDPPDDTLAHKAQSAMLAVADPVGSTIGAGLKVAGNVAATTAKTAAAVAGVAGNIFGAVGSTLGFGTNTSIGESKTPPVSGFERAVFGFVKAVAGSSLNLSDVENLNASQGGAVALAFNKKSPVQSSNNDGEVKGAETEKPYASADGPLIPPPPAIGGAGGISPGFGGGGGGAVSAVTASAPSAPVAPASTSASSAPPVVPTSVPAVVSITSTQSGFDLLPVEQWFSAATPSPQNIVITFDQEVTRAPTVGVTMSPTDPVGTLQTVTDCGDSDTKTFCFDYSIPPNIEAGTNHSIHIFGAENAAGTMLPDNDHIFIVDTLGPTVSVATLFTNSALPTIRGSSLTDPKIVQVLLNNIFYQTIATTYVGDWSITLQLGQELSEGSYTLVASSTDRVGNQGLPMQATFVVDMTPPKLSVASPTEGQVLASTTPFYTDYSASDALLVTTTCTLDSFGTGPCAAFDNTIQTVGVHMLTVTATDAAGNSTVVTRNFTVLQ